MDTEPSKISYNADGKPRLGGITSIMSMARKGRYASFIYPIGALATEIALLYGAYENGGFWREHTARDLLIIGTIHLATAALWPALVVTLVLIYFGALRGGVWDIM
ncbi:hypothetical protein [Bradyrhizobium sp. STM 3562]|uniref:hypothetical protein n=1 Tax=Bradyrhizobium sp. STM 3562 TaxID=578924 RepID=UPI0038907BB5